MRVLSLLVIWFTSTAFAGSAESYCTSEISASLKMLNAERTEAAKDALLKQHRDEVVTHLNLAKDLSSARLLRDAMKLPYDAYLSLVKAYADGLEEKVDWKDGKKSLAATIHSVIQKASGTDATKQELLARVDENSIVPFSTLLKTMEKLTGRERSEQQGLLPLACGPDALTPGGIAFQSQGKRVFTFCPGAVLRASVQVVNGKPQWLDSVKTDALLFTAFHELGHLLGAENGGRYRPMHDDLMACLNVATLAPFPRAQEAEVLADFWGVTGLLAAIEQRNLKEEETIDLVALNLSALKYGEMGGPDHPGFGARQQVVLGQVCSKALHQPNLAEKCHLELSAGAQ